MQIARRILLSGVFVCAWASAPAFADCAGPATDVQCAGADLDGYAGGDNTTLTVQNAATVDDTLGPTIDLGDTANVTVGAGGTVTNNAGGAAAISVGTNSTVTVSGSVTGSDTGVLMTGGGASTLTLNSGGTIDAGGAGPAIEISNGGTNNITIGGTLTSAGSVLFQGNNNAGTLTLLPTAVLTNDGTDGGVIGTNMDFVLGGTGSGTLDTDAITGFGTHTKNTAAAWTLTGGNAQNWTVTAGILSATSDSIMNAQLSTGTALNLDQSFDGTHNGNVSGAGQLTKTGTGIVAMRGTNNYTGTTTIAGGALNIADNTNIGTGALVLNGGTLQYGAGFSSARATALQAGGGTFDTNGFDSTLTGIMSGTGALAKTGAGTLTLNAANTFTGNITIDGGTLSINNNNRLGAAANDLIIDGGTLQATAAVTMTNARTLTLGAGGATLESTTGAFLVQGVISGTGDLTVTGGGTVATSAANTYVGNVNIDGGTLVVSNNNQLGNVNNDITINGGTLRSSGTVTMTNARDIALSGGSTFEVTSGTTSAAGIISGTGGLVKEGAGILSLTGANTYAGGTTVNAGTLQATTTSLTGNVVNNATLTFSQTTTGNYNGDISGTGALIKAGTGTVVLGGTNTHQGGTAINAGTLAFTNDNQLGEASDALTLNGGILRYDAAMTHARDLVTGASNGTLNTNGNAVILDGDISGAGNLTKSGTGTLTLNGNNTYGGTTNVSGGTLVVSSLANIGAGNLGLSGGGAFQYGAAFDTDKNLVLGTGGGTMNTGGFDVELSGVVSGTTRLTKSGAGELVLSGGNTHTGGVTITGGSIRAAADTNLGIGGSLIFNGAGAMLNYDAAFDMTRNVAFTTAGTLDTGGFDSTLSGVVSGAGALTKTGSGVLTLANAANTYTGITTINGGTVSAGANLNLGAATADIAMNGGTLRTTGTFIMTNGRLITLNAGGGTFETVSGTTLTAQGAISGAGDLTKTGDGTLVLSAVNTYTGDTNINGGAIQITNNNQLGNAASVVNFDGGTLRTGAALTSARAVTLNAGGGTVDTNTFNATLSGIIGGSGDFTKTGDGILTLSNANTFTGGILVNGGSLQVSSNANLGDAANTLELDGGTLRLGAAATLARTITLAAGGGTVDTNNFNTTISEDITGTGDLLKTGTGTLALSGATGHSGHTTISAGALQGTTGNIAGDVTTDATLIFSQDTDGMHTASIDGTGGLTKDGTGNVTLDGTYTYDGATTITDGSLTVKSGTIAGMIANNKLLIFDEIPDGEFTGTIAGTGDVEKRGAGNLTFNGNHAYSGDTYVINGTLTVNGDLTNSLVTVSSGGRLGGIGTVDGIMADSGGRVAPGNSIGTLNATGPVTFNPGSFFDVEIDSATADMIETDDVITINGGIVNVIATPGVYPPANIYTILMGTAVNGMFDDLVFNVPWLQGSLTYNADNVVLNITSLAIELGNGGGNENAQGISGLIEAQGPGTPIYDAIVFLPADRQVDALTQLSGEEHTSESAQVASAAMALGDNLFSVMSFSHPLSAMNRGATNNQSAEPAMIEPAAGGREDRHIWAHLLKSRGFTNSTGITSKTDRTATGIMAGMDWIVGGDAYVGVFMAVEDANAKTRDANSSSQTRSITPGLYGGYEAPNGLSWKWLASTTRHTVDTARRIVFPGFSQTTNSSRNGFTVQAQGEVSKTFPVSEDFSIAPFAGLKTAYTRLDDAVENGGGGAGLTVHTGGILDLATVIGSRLRYSLILPDDEKMILEAQLGWQHRFGNDAAHSQVGFSAGGGTFAASSEDLPRDSAVFGLNAGIALSPKSEFIFGYWGQWAPESRDHGLRAGLRADF